MNHCKRNFIYGFIFFFFLTAVSTALAVEPVEVIVEGLSGEELKNVQAALILPPGFVRDGQVDRLWLDHFIGEVPEDVRQALEPFGYYHPEISTSKKKRQPY